MNSAIQTPDFTNRLPGLDAIRGLAALGVMVAHLEQSRLFFGLSTFWPYISERRIGALSVSLFFVLSGFLITHLLLVEQHLTGRIALRDFYVRRVLRIWPLYYLLTFLGFFVIPLIGILEIPNTPAAISNYLPKLSLYLALSPQVAMSFYDPVPYSAVLWSVGVEEWFYLFWPWMLLLPRRSLLFIIPAIIVGLALSRWGFRTGASFYFFSQIRFDCMAIGAIGALLWRYSHQNAGGSILNVMLSQLTWLIAIIGTIICLCLGIRFGVFDDLIYSALFALIILNACIRGRGACILNLPALRYLGKISYGTYCFNWIAHVLALVIIKTTFPDISMSHSHQLHYVLGFGLTLGVAAFSYHFFERPFLYLKAKIFSPLQIYFRQ